ncbi:MAG: 30S ribosomal protein S20 [Candidatus Latescibacteria bacterium]|nr:30S ribosomal protein S20 [Candidatus Latescibacterota bacterium]
MCPIVFASKEFLLPKLRSALKSVIKNRRGHLRNAPFRTRMRTCIKAVDQATDKESAQQALERAISILDKTVNKGLLHRNTAARYKSRLSRKVNGLD